METNVDDRIEGHVPGTEAPCLSYSSSNYESASTSTNLTQDMFDLELLEAIPFTPNITSCQGPVEDSQRDQADALDVEEIDDDSDFEYCTDFEFMSPLIYSPISSPVPSEGYEKSSIHPLEENSDDEMSGMSCTPLKKKLVGKVITPKIDNIPFEYHGNIHPLLIPNILGDIFKCVSSLKDLRNFRLVNSIWNAESCEALQKRFTVTFLDHHSISTYLTVFPTCQRIHPHAIYQFYNTEFSDSNAVLNQFLTEFGPRIRTLILQLTDVPYEKLYNVLRHQLINLRSLWLRCVPLARVDREEETKMASGSIRTFPQVRTLIIGTRDFTYTSSTDLAAVRTRNGLENLISLFPNLRKISQSRLDHVINPLYSLNFLRAIVAVGPNRLKYLTTLDFPLEVDEQMLSEIVSLKCPYLNDLDLTITSAVRTQIVADFFNMVGSRMSKLSLSFPKIYPYGFQHARLLGQDLRKVTELTLSRFRWNLGFLQDMLLLDKLVFKDTEVGSIFPVNMNIKIKLRVLRIETEENTSLPRIDAPVLEKITRTFPWLKVLHVPGVTDACLRVIYFDLPCLTTLECVKGEFTDYGVTGVDLEVCKDLAETTTYLVVNADRLRTNLFIGNLTNLNHLKLESDSIGDLSILFGVCKCLKLDWLYLKSVNITDLAIEALADQLGHSLRALNILNCSGVTEAGKFYFRESLRLPDILVDFELHPENERATERANASRYHRYCDAFVRRKHPNSRASERAGDDESFAAYSAASAGRRLSRHLRHRLDAVVINPVDNNPGQAQGFQQELAEIEDVPFQILPLNLEEYQNHARGLMLAGIERGDVGNIPPPPGIYNPLLDQFMEDFYP